MLALNFAVAEAVDCERVARAVAEDVSLERSAVTDDGEEVG